MAHEEKLKLGKGTVFVKTQLKRLPQHDEVWEADFRAMPKPIMQTETEYLGMVVSTEDGWYLADQSIEDRPSVNDLANLLAHAMRRPLVGHAHRPRRIRLRGHPQWRELFPDLEDVGIDVEVSVKQGLPSIDQVYEASLRQIREQQKKDKIKPSAKQAKVESLFPNIARYVRGHGYIEIGDQEEFGFVARAISYGGLDFEDETSDSLAEALAALEAGLAEWLEDL